MMNRTIGLVTIVLVAMSVMFSIALAAPTAQEVAGHEKKWRAHQEDLVEIARNIQGGDVEIAINLIDLANRYSIELAYIQDLLIIDSLIQGVADKRRVKPVISTRIKSAEDGIDLSIKQVNLSLAHLSSQALIATATRMRDDLRALKELLTRSD